MPETRHTAPADPGAGHDLRALTVRWFHEVWNQGRLSTVNELLAARTRVHGLGAPEAPTGADAAAGATPASAGNDGGDGREQFLRFYHTLRAGFPDAQITIEDLLRDGDKTAARLTCRATHAGPAFGVPATGRRVTFTAMVLIHWQDGKMVEAWNEVDAAGLVRQMT